MEKRLRIEKVVNKNGCVKYGTPIINFQVVTFENGTKGIYVKDEDSYNLKLMDMETAVQLACNNTISDLQYTVQSILWKHEDWHYIPMNNNEHILWSRGLGKYKLQILNNKEVA